MNQEGQDQREPIPGKDMAYYVDMENIGKDPFKGIDSGNFNEKLSEVETAGFSTQENRASKDKKYFERNGRTSLFPGHSKDHQLICSLGAIVDIDNFRQELSQFEDSSDIELFKKWLDRYQEMEERMADLYRIDMMRRAGHANDDKKLVEAAQKKFNGLTNELLASIQEYEKDNKGFIPREEGLAERIDNLKQNIENKKGNFYDDVCQEYSYLIFIEFEKFRKQILHQVAERIKQAGTLN